jgi:hypothetical protein
MHASEGARGRRVQPPLTDATKAQLTQHGVEAYDASRWSDAATQRLAHAVAPVGADGLPATARPSSAWTEVAAALAAQGVVASPQQCLVSGGGGGGAGGDDACARSVGRWRRAQRQRQGFLVLTRRDNNSRYTAARNWLLCSFAPPLPPAPLLTRRRCALSAPSHPTHTRAPSRSCTGGWW